MVGGGSLRMYRLQNLAALERLADSLRVLVALTGVIFYTGLRDNPHELIPLVLGVIASAIAETDDSWRKRTTALMVTLACFSLAALTVEGLFEMPWLFGLALFAGCFVLVMMGAVSGRYATIANATLLLAVYTMIGVDQHAMPDAPFWREPMLLVAGAAWYGLLALLWNAIFVHRPVRHALARLYDALGAYLDGKARLFEPVREPDIAGKRMALAQINARVVAALNDTRLALIDRLEGRRSRSAMDENLRLYLAAQDIHERASSSHYPYQALTRAFFHSDLMFRCERLLRRMGDACRRRGGALRVGDTFTDAGPVEEALEVLLEPGGGVEGRHRLAAPPRARRRRPPAARRAKKKVCDRSRLSFWEGGKSCLAAPCESGGGAGRGGWGEHRGVRKTSEMVLIPQPSSPISFLARRKSLAAGW